MTNIFQMLRAYLLSIMLVFSTAATFHQAYAQEKPGSESGKDNLLAAAREIMTAARYCALITVDASGHPQARVMDPFLPEDDMVVWLATNPKSRKVEQLRRDSRVTLFYFDQGGLGYVSLIGHAQLVNDPEEKASRWKEEWQQFYPNRETDYLLISITPEKLEIVSAKHNIVGDSKTWAAPTLLFDDQ
ncbi:MAG: pyridoxamine 5'-phosphate oxidase family protein [bacterium]